MFIYLPYILFACLSNDSISHSSLKKALLDSQTTFAFLQCFDPFNNRMNMVRVAYGLWSMVENGYVSGSRLCNEVLSGLY